MRKDIHPTYHPQARVKCACGNEFIVGSTQEKTEVETCSNCHPFYTGAERGAIRGGRVEKFQSRLEKQVSLQKEGANSPKNKATKKAEKRARKAQKSQGT
jgi:large subunit ribosomal protein L31